MYDYCPPMILMNFRQISDIFQLSDLICAIGTDKWGNITENELWEFRGKEKSLKILNDLREWLKHTNWL